MRFGAKTLGVLVASSVGVVMWGGCKADKQTELVPGVVSQIQVPRNLKTVRIDIQPQGQQSTCFIRSVDPNTGGVQLPRTLGIVPNGDNGRLVTVTVTGYTVAEDDPSSPKSLQDCLFSPFNDGNYAAEVKILRRSRQPYVDGKILFVPMPLRYSCWEAQGCKDTETCVAGACVPADVDPHTLPEFRDNLVDGTSNTCFSASKQRCFANLASGGDAAPATLVDAASCTYKYNDKIPVQGSGLNVKVFYDHGEAEILDKDDATTAANMREGFIVPDPAKPAQFQLAPSLCDMVKGTNPKRKILDVYASTLCPSKTLLQPLCVEDTGDAHSLPDGGTSADGGCNISNELQPAPSALYVLLDNGHSMAPIFGPTGLSQVLGLSLGDPVFRTTSIGFKLLPHAMADCSPATTTSFAMQDVAFDAATKVQNTIARIVGDTTRPLATDPPLFIDAALQPNGAYKALRDFRAGKPFNRSALMLILNRPVTNDCGGMDAATLAGNAFNAATAADRIYTYVIFLDNTAGTMDSTAAQAIATAGGPPGATQFFDARGNPGAGLNAVNSIVSDLGSCLYEKPANIDTSAVIAYTDPLSQMATNVTFNASCNEAAQSTADGWNIDAGRVRICGKACSDLRVVLTNAANFAALQTPPASPPNIPVTATQLCK